MNKTWSFPPSGHVLNQGAGKLVNDEFKNQPIINLAREVIQNSLDAVSSDSSVTVEFRMFTLPTSSFPGIHEYLDFAIKLNNQYKDKNKYPKEYVIVKNILRSLNSPNMTWLRISDFGTSGLWGTSEPSNDETPWFAFIKSAGKNQKGQLAGGSKGLGKDAIFANSTLTSMFVSTQATNLNNQKEERSSIGISRQPSLRLIEQNPERPDWTQGIGFYVDNNEESLRFLNHSNNELELDPEFNRNNLGNGTDIYLPAFEFDEDWEDQIILEAITSFLPAIMAKELTILVSNDESSEKKVINASSIGSFVNGKGKSNKVASSLLKLYKSDLTKVIKFEKKPGFEMTLRLQEQPLDGLNCIYEYRFPTKMKIVENKKVSSSLNFTAILLIEGKEICSRLRSVENATHNQWAINRWKDTEYTKDQIQEAIDTVNSFVREEIDKLNHVDFSDSYFMNLDGWNTEEDYETLDVGSKSETGLPTNEIIVNYKSESNINKLRKRFKKSGNVQDEESDIETNILDLGLPGEDQSTTGINLNSKNGNNGGPNLNPQTNNINPNTGEKSILTRKSILALNAKFPSINLKEGLFDLVFIPSKTGTDVKIEISKLGAAGENAETKIVFAKLNNTELHLKNNRISIPKIEKGKEYRLNLKLQEDRNYIWEVKLDAEE